MGKRVILIERENRLQSFNLPHDQFCAAVGKCSCSRVILRTTVQDKRTGVRRVKPVERLTPKSITLLPRSRSTPLPIEVLKCDEVKAALNARPRRIAYVESG